MSRILIPILSLVLLAGPAGVKAQSQQVVADKIIAVVGNSAILYSDVVAMSFRMEEQRREQGYTSDKDPRTEALEALMLQKLLFNQAKIDSLEISTDDINMIVENNISQEVAERGSIAALEAFYHKPIFNVKEDMHKYIEESRYAQRMKQEVEGKVKVTPGEVERYYKSIGKDSLPIIPEQYIYAHIVIFPPSTAAAKQRVKERLLDMRERIIGGTKLSVLARMYSVDGSAVRGGEMDPTPKDGFVKPFADALVKLKPGQISEVVETEFGFHLIELIEKKGSLYTCRHILLRPVFTSEELAVPGRTLDSIATKIKEGSITFAEAAGKFSQDSYSKLNGGIVTNHEMLELYNAFDAKLTSTKFLKEELPKDDYQRIRNMKVGDISAPFQSQDMRSNVMSKIIMLKEIIPSHPANLANDYLRMEEMTLEEKTEREFEKWLNKKIAGMYVRIDEEFRGSNFENKMWVK